MPHVAIALGSDTATVWIEQDDADALAELYDEAVAAVRADHSRDGRPMHRPPYRTTERAASWKHRTIASIDSLDRSPN